MTDLVSEMRRAYDLKGDTYSSMEVFGMLSRGANEIEQLRTALTELLADLDDPDLIDISAATIARARQALNAASPKPPGAK